MLMTIDIGTSVFKAALWNYDGKRKSVTSVPSLMLSKNSAKKRFIHEADPMQWINAFEQCCKNIKNLSKVRAIIISGNGPSLVPVFGKPKKSSVEVPAANARLWLDRRAIEYQAEVSAVMGGYVDASFFLPKILYIKNEENNLYKKTKHFLGCPEFLAYALTGQACTVFPCEGFDRWFWNKNILDKLELDIDKFPAFIQPGERFGELNLSAAEYFGFKKNIPVISGGPDFFAAILGSGVTKPGQICNRTGSSDGINLCTNNYVNNDRFMSYKHPVNHYWNLSGIINTTGKAIDWGCSFLGINGFDDFIALAEKSKTGSGGLKFDTNLAGERVLNSVSYAGGNLYGINLSSGRNEFANSILEGIGFAVMDIITEMEKTGAKTEQLRVTGGLAGCEILNQIKADITGIEVLEIHKEAELYGLAITGLCSLGKFSSYAEASSAMIKIRKNYKPNPEKTKCYNHLFNEYKKLKNP